MAVLDLKLLRDIRRLWAQALAIALVIAGAVATLVLAVGSHRSLEETRIAYYERHRFADVFASVRRAPKTLVGRIAEISGVAAADVRIASRALAACQQGLCVSFSTAAALVNELMEARDERRLLRLQKQMVSNKLLIIDELGFVPLSKTGAELLFELISQRYERGAALSTKAMGEPDAP